MKIIEKGQKLICIRFPEKNYDFYFGNFGNFGYYYSILSTYEVIDKIKRPKKSTTKGNRYLIGKRYTLENTDMEQKHSWWFSIKEIRKFFLVVK